MSRSSDSPDTTSPIASFEHTAAALRATLAHAAEARLPNRSARLRFALSKPARATPLDTPAGGEELADQLTALLDGILACTEADMGNIQLYDRTDGALRIRAQRGFEKPFLEFFAEVRGREAACGTALATGARVIVPDVAVSPLFTQDARAAVLDAGARAVQSAVLVSRTRRRLGVVSVHYRQPGIPRVNQDLFGQIAPQLADVLALADPSDS